MSGRPRTFEPEVVLAQAMHTFWTTGYAQTGIAELERATGLGRQSLYGAFGDKRALFMRVLELYIETVIKPGLVYILDAPGSARANLERVFDSWLAAGADPNFPGCLICKTVLQVGADDPGLADKLRAHLQSMEDAFARALRRARRDGELPAELPVRQTARVLLTLAQGLSAVTLVQREPGFLRDLVRGARQLLC